jgi:hypothetical protein
MTKIVYNPSKVNIKKPLLLLSIIFIQCAKEIGDLGRGEELTLGLAIALAISALVNLAFLISPRTRDILLSAGRRLIRKVQAVGANPNANPTLPDPPADPEAPKEAVKPPPPTPLPPAIVWPTVRPSAPAPPPRQLFYGAKGIFETGKKHFI